MRGLTLDIEKNFEKKIEKHRAEIADKIQIDDPKSKKKKKKVFVNFFTLIKTHTVDIKIKEFMRFSFFPI